MNIDVRGEKMEHNKHVNDRSDSCDKCQREAKHIRNFFNILDIPIMNSVYKNGTPSVHIKVQAHVLYDILTDEQKLKDLVSKLKLKAFW